MSGAIRHILVDPVNSHRLYAAAENGGLWVLDDDRHLENGWRPLSDNLDNLQMRGIAKSSVNPNYIVTANAAGFVYHTKDHGTTWTKVIEKNFQYIHRILISEGLTRIPVGNYEKLAKETRLWVACRLGLFRIRLINDTFDGIDQLYPQHTLKQKADVLDVVRNPMNDDLYVGVRDQGVWQRLGVPTDSSNAWILSANWADFGDLESAMIKLAISRSGSRIVAKFGRRVIVNDEGGLSSGWVRISPIPFGNDTGGSDIGYRGNYSKDKGEWSHAIAVSPTDQNVIAVGQDALFISSNGGDEWVKTPYSHEDMQSLAFSHDGTSLFIANDGGVFRLPILPGNPAPVSLNVKLTTSQFFRVGLNGNVAVGNADHQGIWGTRNIEASPIIWERATPRNNGFGNNALENDFVTADLKTPGRFFVQFDSQHLLRLMFPPTSNVPTENLLPLNPTMTPLKPFTSGDNRGILSDNEFNAVFNQLNYPVGTVAVDPRSGTNIILVAVHVNRNRTFGIQKTLNANVDPSGGPRIECPPSPPESPVGGCFQNPVIGTATWKDVFGPVSIPIVSISFSPSEPGKAYALDQAGGVFVLRNIDDPRATFQSSGSFVVIPTDFARQIIADPKTPGRFLALTHRQIQLSTDGNATVWNRIGQATLPAVQLNALCLHPKDSKIVYLATASGVHVSNNGGEHWSSIGMGLANVPVMNVFTSPTHLYAATFGRGLWRTKLPT